MERQSQRERERERRTESVAAAGLEDVCERLVYVVERRARHVELSRECIAVRRRDVAVATHRRTVGRELERTLREQRVARAEHCHTQTTHIRRLEV